jgi:hypothetical protein
MKAHPADPKKKGIAGGVGMSEIGRVCGPERGTMRSVVIVAGLAALLGGAA